MEGLDRFYAHLINRGKTIFVPAEIRIHQRGVDTQSFTVHDDARRSASICLGCDFLIFSVPNFGFPGL